MGAAGAAAFGPGVKLNANGVVDFGAVVGVAATAVVEGEDPRDARAFGAAGCG